MSNPFIADNSNKKLEAEANRYLTTRVRNAEKGVEKSIDKTKKVAGKVAGKAAQKTFASTKGLQDYLVNNLLKGTKQEEHKEKVDAKDILRGKKNISRTGKVLRGFGDKVRGLGKGGKALNTAQKGAKAAKTAQKGAKIANAAQKGTKAVKAAKMGATALKVAKVAKVAKTGRNALKLAQLGKIALTGGAALAGGPVGIALFAGSIAAPYAIGAIWKNREKIYEGGKNLAIKSQLKADEIVGIVKGKGAEVGDIVPEAKGLTVEDNGGKTLLQVDNKGKVKQNNFEDKIHLAFIQGEGKEKKMLLDEEDIRDFEYVDEWQSTSEATIDESNVAPEKETLIQKDIAPIQTPEKETLIQEGVAPVQAPEKNKEQPTINLESTIEVGSDRGKTSLNANPEIAQGASNIPNTIVPEDTEKSAIAPPAQQEAAVGEPGIVATGEISGVDVVRNSLAALALNNPNNAQIQATTSLLGDTIDAAEANAKTPAATNKKQKFNANQAGSAVMDLFNRESKDDESLSTQKYDIERKGRTFFLKDKEGNTLLEASKTMVGTKVVNNIKDPEQMQDLKFLGEDLADSRGITGGFKPPTPQASKANDSDLTPGKTLIDLFDRHSPDGQPIETAEYNIHKQGNQYQLQDKEGKTLFSAQKEKSGDISVQGKLTNKLKQEFTTLKQDLAKGDGALGFYKMGFRLVKAGVMATAGAALIGLFKEHSKDKETLATKDYDISRRGNQYALRDKNKNLLMVANDTPAGIETKIAESGKLKQDLDFLSQELAGKMPLTGGFKPEAENLQTKKVDPAAQTPANAVVSTKTEPTLTNRFEKYKTNENMQVGSSVKTKTASKGMEIG